MNLNTLAIARLNPAIAPTPPGMTVTRADVSPRLPYQLDIEFEGLRAFLTLSTGLVRPIVQLAPSTVVMSSEQDTTARPAATSLPDMLAQSRSMAHPRLIFAAGSTLVGQCPLTIGTDVLIPTGPKVASAGVQLRVTGYALNASALVGKGAVGSWVEFSWRAITAGQEDFDSLVMRPKLRGKVFYSRTVNDQIERVQVDDATFSEGSGDPAFGLNWGLQHG